MTTREEFFQAHAVDGVLSDEKMAELALMPEGESGAKPQSSEPDAAEVVKPAEVKTPEDPAEKSSKDSEVKEPSKADPDPATINAQNAVILSKHGNYTIGYEKLEEAREREKVAREQAAAATAELERLKLENETLKRGSSEAGATPKAGADGKTTEPPEKGPGKPAIDFGDYSEEAMAKAALQLERLVDSKVQERVDAASKDIESRSLAPMAEQLEKAAVKEHYQAIYSAHPDADSIAESKELSDWIDKQPTFARDAYRTTLTQGATNDVVELFTAFKDATGKTGAAQVKAEPDKKGEADAATAAAAQAAIAAAKAKPPSSLSEIPAGSSAHHDEAAAMLEKSGVALMNQFEGKSPAEIHALLNKVL